MDLAARTRSGAMALLTNKMTCSASSCKPLTGKGTLQRPRGIAWAGLWGSSRKGRSQRAAREGTGSTEDSSKAEQLKVVLEELATIRLRRLTMEDRQQEELSKNKPNATKVENLEKSIARLVADKQELLEICRGLAMAQPEGLLQLAEEMTEFAAAIPAFPEQADEDGFLHFPVPVPFLEGGTVMFVRDVHKALWKHVANSSFKGFVVTGNAGIGKSWWLVWVLIKLLKAGEEVLWHSESEGAVRYILFDGKGGVKRIIFDQASKVLEDGGANYLVDGAVPHASKDYRFKLSLVAHSYKPGRFKGYLRQMRIVYNNPLFMDPWTPTEILKAAAELHPQLSSSLVKERLDVFGGIPRQVFLESRIDPMIELERAMVNLKWDELVSGFTPEAAAFPETASHRLLMISAPKWTSGDFTTCDVAFRSETISRRVAKQVVQRFGEQLRAFLSASGVEGASGIRSLQGQAMEEYMHKVFPGGGIFRVRELLPARTVGRQPKASLDAAAGEVTELHLPLLQKELFSDVKQLPSIVDAYAVPMVGNFPGIDALHPSSGRMFQCTVSKEHVLKAGIFETLEQLDSSITPAIYVVVPTQGTFAAWTYGMVVPKVPESASNKVKQHRNNLKQYVLLLEPIAPAEQSANP